MDKENKIYKIVGRIMASVFSVLLVAFLLGACVYNSARNLVTSKSVTEIVKKSVTGDSETSEEILNQMVGAIASTEDGSAALENDLAKQVLNELLDSSACQDTLQLYLSDTVAAFADEGDEEQFTLENVRDVLSENSEEIVDIIMEIAPNESRSELEANFDDVIDKNLPEVMAKIPAPSKIVDEIEVPVVKTVVGTLVSTRTIVIAWLCVVILAAVIVACRAYRFKFLRWLGIDGLIASTLVLIPAIMLKAGFLTALLKDLPIISVIDVFGSNLLTAGIVVFLISTVLLAGSIVLSVLYGRKGLVI